MPVLRDPAEYCFLLALESSGDAVSVALMKYGGCIAFKQHDARFGHAEYLVDMVQDIMEEADAVFGCETQALIASLHCNIPTYITIPPWAPKAKFPHESLIYLSHIIY